MLAAGVASPAQSQTPINMSYQEHPEYNLQSDVGVLASAFHLMKLRLFCSRPSKKWDSAAIQYFQNILKGEAVL